MEIASAQRAGDLRFPGVFCGKISDLPEKRQQIIRQKRKLTGRKIR